MPGVGPVTAIAFAAAIDDPTRFRHCRQAGAYLGLTPRRYQSGEIDHPTRFRRRRQVGAYLGLTPRRYQSGEIDRKGRVSKAGDGLTRALPFEAANALLTRSRKPSALKARAEAIAARCGCQKAKVAWQDGLLCCGIVCGVARGPCARTSHSSGLIPLPL